MPLVILIFGAILLVAAYKDTQGSLFTNLGSDLPGFGKWFLALAVVGGLQYVPGMRVPARWLLALVLVVIFMANYSKILSGIKNAASGAGSSASAQTDPATAYATANSGVTTAQIQGTSPNASTGSTNTASTSSTGTSGTASTVAAYLSPYDPEAYLQTWLQQNGSSTSSVYGSTA